MIESIVVKYINNSFKELLRKDIKELHQSNEVFVSGDKSTNFYNMKKKKYEKQLLKNIIKVC